MEVVPPSQQLSKSIVRLTAAAQDPKLEEPPEGAFQCQRGEWNDLPAEKLLETVAFENSSNWTGHMDWCAGSKPLNTKLEAITTGFCDNFVLKCIVAPDQIKLTRPGDKRSQKYTEFGTRCAKIREIISQSAIVLKPDAVTGARLFAVNECKGSGARVPTADEMGLPNVFINRDPKLGLPADENLYWQYFKIACPDADMQAVINLIRSGVFARHGLFLNDFDVTIDCKGGVRMQDLIKHLIGSNTGFCMEGDKGDDSDCEEDDRPARKTILNNAHKVGRNCVTWLVQMDGMCVRVKLYLKLVQEFEKQSVRSSVGQHISDWIEMIDTRLAYARDTTKEYGLCRSESTLYVDAAQIPISESHLHIPVTAPAMTLYAQQQLDVVPPELVLQAGHALMVSNWAANLKQTLVVVDTLYDLGLVVYAKNEVTHTVSGTAIRSWKRRSKYVLQKLALGDHPVDVVYLNRGAVHEPVDQELPGAVSRKEEAAEASKRSARSRSKLHVWVDRDADGTLQRSITEMLGTKRTLDDEPAADGGDIENDSSESEEEEELDTAAQVAVALSKLSVQHSFDIIAAQAAASADTTSTLDANDAVQWAAPVGGLVVVAKRYHRVPISGETHNPTEFPPSGGLEHFFHLPRALVPELEPLNPAPTGKGARIDNQDIKDVNKNRIIQATRGLVDAMVATAGFRPAAQMNTLDVQPRVDATPISNRINDAHLVESTIAPVVDLNAVLGATRMMAFSTPMPKRRAAKEKLRLQRNKERIVSLAAAAAERSTVVDQKAKTDASVALKCMLRGMYKGQKGRSMHRLAPGAHPLIAVRLGNKTVDLFVMVCETIVPYNATAPLNAAIKENALKLAPLYNSLGDADDGVRGAGVFYLNRDLNCAPIGSLTLFDSSIKEASGRLLLDCRLIINGETLVQSLEDKREANAQVADPMLVEAPAVAHLVLSEDERRGSNTPYLDEAFPLVANAVRPLVSCVMPRVVRVLKLAKARNNAAHCDSVWLQVAEDAFVNNIGPTLVRGGPTLNSRVDELTQDCRIIIYKSLAKHQLNCKIVQADEFTWLNRLPAKYDLIPALFKGVHHCQPTAIPIAWVGNMQVRGSENPVIVGEDGRPWRFKSPQNIKPNAAKKRTGLDLQVGFVLDTVNFALAPHTAGGTGYGETRGPA